MPSNAHALLVFLRGFALQNVGAEYLLPESVSSKGTAYCLDLVTADSTSTCCFTKNYGRFNRGTGSVLQTIASAPDNTRTDDHSERGLRYFTPVEIARLHHFPVRDFDNSITGTAQQPHSNQNELQTNDASVSEQPDSAVSSANGTFPAERFSFPATLSLKQQYALLGNSLNVYVVAQLLQYMLKEPPHALQQQQ